MGGVPLWRVLFQAVSVILLPIRFSMTRVTPWPPGLLPVVSPSQFARLTVLSPRRLAALIIGMRHCPALVFGYRAKINAFGW